MNFIEAVQFANSGIAVKRRDWADGVRLSVHKGPGYREDEIRVYHVATCAVSLTATDVLAHDWDVIISLPNWFEVGKKVRHKSSGNVYHIISISNDIWVGCWDGLGCDGTYEYEFPLWDIEKSWSSVE